MHNGPNARRDGLSSRIGAEMRYFADAETQEHYWLRYGGRKVERYRAMQFSSSEAWKHKCAESWGFWEIKTRLHKFLERLSHNGTDLWRRKCKRALNHSGEKNRYTGNLRNKSQTDDVIGACKPEVAHALKRGSANTPRSWRGATELWTHTELEAQGAIAWTHQETDAARQKSRRHKSMEEWNYKSKKTLRCNGKKA